MINFIQSIFDTSQDIIYQLINEEMLVQKTSLVKQLKLKENIGVISSVMNKGNSFQIVINFSEELVKKISSLVHGGIPIVLIDDESKHIIMEISKLIMSNSIIHLEEYDEFCSLSPPCIIEGGDTTYSTNGLVNFIEFKLMGEKLTIAIFPVDKTDDIFDIKTIEKSMSS